MARFTAERAKELLEKHSNLSNPVIIYLSHIADDNLASYYSDQISYFQSIMADENRSIDLLVYNPSSDSFVNSDDGKPNSEYVDILKYKIKRAQHDGVLVLSQERSSTMLRSYVNQILDIGSENKVDYSRDNLFSIHMGLKFLKNYFDQNKKPSIK
jgi:hypothetical protein